MHYQVQLQRCCARNVENIPAGDRKVICRRWCCTRDVEVRNSRNERITRRIRKNLEYDIVAGSIRMGYTGITIYFDDNF